jgi:hypothetical protein
MLQDAPDVADDKKNRDDVKEDQLSNSTAPLIVISAILRHRQLEHWNGVVDHEKQVETRYCGAKKGDWQELGALAETLRCPRFLHAATSFCFEMQISTVKASFRRNRVT